MIYSSNSRESGFITRTNGFSDYHIDDLEGALLAVRRTGELPLHRKVLGKTLPESYPLVSHLVDSAGVAKVLWESVLSEQQKRAIIAGIGGTEHQAKLLVITLAGLHDVGKAHAHWQPTLGVAENDFSLMDSASGESLPIPELVDPQIREHQLAGAVFFARQANGTSLSSRSLRSVFSKIVWAHHGVFSSENLSEIMRVKGHLFNDAGWFNVRQEIEQDIFHLLGFVEDDFRDIKKWSNSAVTMVTGIVILADWIASRADFITNAPDSTVSLDEHYQSAQSRAEFFLKEQGVYRAGWEENVSWETIFPKFTPNPLQESVLSLFNAVESDSLPPTAELLPTPGSDGGILIMTAPMGSGKTEAALAAASIWGKISGSSGIWVTLPTQATSESMFPRAIEISKKVFKGSEHSISLMHSNSSISAAVEGQKIRGLAPWRSSDSVVTPAEQIEAGSGDASQDSSLFISSFLVEKKLGGMAGMTISTVDQAISAVLRIKHTPLRWLGAAGNVIILDEVHDFDAYTFSLILKFVAWAGALGMPIIAMSATLSGESQRELIKAYWAGRTEVSREPLVNELLNAIPLEGIPSPSWVFAGATPSPLRFSDKINEVSKPKPYKTRLIVEESFTRVVHSQIDDSVIEKSGQLLVVCNTVSQAIAVTQSIEDKYGEQVPTVLLHSRLKPRTKERIVKDILTRSGKNSGALGRLPYVLIATQVVEQSLDIDFDCMVSALGPLDSCLQRVGRVFRHDQERAESFISAAEINFVVHPNVIRVLTEGVPEERTLPGFSPYSYWEILATLEVLKKFIPLSTLEGDYQEVDFKGELGEFFKEYSTIISQVKNGTNNTASLKQSFEQASNVVQSMQEFANIAEIPDPLFSETSWSTMTTKRTQRSSHAPGTRLIDDRRQGNIVIVDGTSAKDMHILRKKLVHRDRDQIRRLCGQASISFNIDEIPEVAIIDKEKLGLKIPDHIILVSKDVLVHYPDFVVYNDKYGLFTPNSLARAWV